MSYQIRRSSDRKYFDHGWLKTYHTFSFGSYYDPKFMGFKDLRVINEDRVDPGHGFPEHDHKDMEIISIVLEGNLGHKDSMGHESVILPNEVQAMSAGKGITHSEYNPAATQVHFLQIWIIPDTKGVTPRYQQTQLPQVQNQWVLVASKEGLEGSIKVHQDVKLYAISFDEGKKAEKKTLTNRYGWLQVIEGDVKMNEDILKSGDGVAIDPDTSLNLKAISKARVLFFDLKA